MPIIYHLWNKDTDQVQKCLYELNHSYIPVKIRSLIWFQIDYYEGYLCYKWCCKGLHDGEKW